VITLAPFRLIVFDLDGTLVDSRQDIAESANAALVACGAQPLSEEALGRMVGDGAPKLIARAFAAAGVKRPTDALDRFLAIYDSRLLSHTRPYAGIPELLDQLARRASLAVLTNKPLAAAQRILSGLDLSRYFPPNRVVGGDGPFPRKPDPAGLAHLMASSGVSPGVTALVGDSVVDWRTAAAATTRVVLARYGFGWEGFPIDQLESDAWVVDSPAEMLMYL
jgi:phosphoglycolate phosphatase